MPNWCENKLGISGPEGELNLFLLRAKGEEGKPLSFQSLYPMPEELAGTSSPGDSPNWYDWRVQHWGTKWDVGDVHAAEGSATSVEFSFDTAWAPPTALIEKVSEDFPGLRFRLDYAEMGMCFAGFEERQAGELLEGSQGTPEDYEWSRKLIWNWCEDCDEDYQPYVNGHTCEKEEK